MSRGHPARRGTGIPAHLSAGTARRPRAPRRGARRHRRRASRRPGKESAATRAGSAEQPLLRRRALALPPLGHPSRTPPTSATLGSSPRRPGPRKPLPQGGPGAQPAGTRGDPHLPAHALAVAGPAPGAEHSPTESAVGVAGLTCCSLQVLVGWWAEEVGWEGGETLLKLAGQHIPRKYLPC